LLGLASQVDTKNIRSYVFAPPLYGQEVANSPRGYIIEPAVDKIRAAVSTAFTANPADEALREKLAEEAGTVWVLNSTGGPDRASRLAAYLEYYGLAASAPRQKPSGGVRANTTIVVYNGASTALAGTIAYLQQTFGVTATTKTDSSVRADILVTIGTATPDLQPPAGP
ncbi:MAG: LytR C-terminal domain-containing protein, partial [Candidatus Limnocylindrales bacterium]